MDYGRETNGFSFPFNEGETYYYNQSIPEVAVGYYLDFFRNEFEKNQMKLVDEALLGVWRHDDTIESKTGFSQDILIFKK